MSISIVSVHVIGVPCNFMNEVKKEDRTPFNMECYSIVYK